jgi:hypothetical protein
VWAALFASLLIQQKQQDKKDLLSSIILVMRLEIAQGVEELTVMASKHTFFDN